jgi:protein-S-isoprenylcysteine O-methyltransferase Ste14
MTISNAAFWSMWPFSARHIGLILLGSIFIIFEIFSLVSSLWEFNSIKKISGLEANKVINTGIYKHSRNPQYLAVFLIVI